MRVTTSLLVPAVLAVLAGCSDGNDGVPGPPGPPGEPGGGTDDDLVTGEDLPGLVLTILSVTGATGLGGNFQTGDSVTVTFQLLKDDGGEWSLDELAFGRAHLAGPTFNYQRVLPEVDDVRERAVYQGIGTWRYTFAAPLPAVYAPPYNDTPFYDGGDGELSGQTLLDGTYTVALGLGWSYTLDGELGFVDVGEAALDVLFGASASLAPRAVTDQANCNLCHGELRAHEDERRQLVQCLMCHTSGAEDGNDPAVGLGTPGVSIESRVLFHKIHSANHLPSVVGVGVTGPGFQDYTAPPEPLLYQTDEGELIDYSWIGFPAFPNRLIPRERNLGWSALDDAAQTKEDRVQRGIVECFVCHGDPDGAGPLKKPADGDLVFSQPTRRACGSCHDDIIWTQPYRTNNQLMPPQLNDSECTDCHDNGFGPLAVGGGHEHPLEDPFLNPGRNVALLGFADLGGDADGSLDAGEQLEVTFTLTDDSGADVDASDVDAVHVVLAGPTTSQQLLLDAVIPSAALPGPQPYVALLQERALLEYLGDSTTTGGEAFTTARAPHLAAAGAETVIELGVAAGAASTLAAALDGPASFLDLVDASGFAADDVVVIDRGGAREEYARVQAVDGDRLWLGAPGSPTGYTSGASSDHPAGTAVRAVTPTPLVEGVDYALDPATGLVTELVEFGDGRAVLATYTAPFELPVVYPSPHHDSPDAGEVEGEWRGKSLEPGTYSLTLWAEDTFTTLFAGHTNVYPNGSVAQRLELPVLDPGALEPYDRIDLPAACNDCHQDVSYHSQRYRGFASCLACHGGSGVEDRPDWVSGNAPETPGRRIDMRSLFHALHQGHHLTNPLAYVVVGEGPDPPPDDFTARTYDNVGFPADPGGAAECARCHGAGSAWEEPPERGHPLEQGAPARIWRDVCATCHDSAAAVAHIDSHTAGNGVESCTICHGPGETWSVRAMHRGY